MTLLWHLFRALHRAALPGPWGALAVRFWLKTPAGAAWLAGETERQIMGSEMPVVPMRAQP